MANEKVLIYLFRNDLRVADHPVLDYLASVDHGFTHLLPVYVFPALQMDLSGFIQDEEQKQRFQVKTSRVGHFPRCGPYRAKFIAESVWDLKSSLKSLDSDLLLRVGEHAEVVEDLVDAFQSRKIDVGAVWMTGHVGSEEQDQEQAVSAACKVRNVKCKIWQDEKYFIDDRDLNFSSPDKLPEVFTTYLRSVEPLREKPRKVLPTPAKSSLPAVPDVINISPQFKPFVIPEQYDELEEALVKPVREFLKNMPMFPSKAVSAHPFKGGEVAGHQRLNDVILHGVATGYKDTRNGLLGVDFSTKLSAYLAQGSLTARQIHHELRGFEDGTTESFRDVDGFGKGEVAGTKGIREELLWRDYMCLYHKKINDKLFQVEGVRDYKDPDKKPQWKTGDSEKAGSAQDPDPAVVGNIISRFLEGTTGMGLIDASQRELLHTGYTSNRARQNVANFLAKHLNIDWRYGAEWYEMLLIDYDVSSNWANWQYVSGVGNDPRSESRFFNPVKQAFDYDKEGEYVRTWVPEIGKLQKLENVFQACTASEADIREAGLEGSPMVVDPIKRIEFSVEGKPRTHKRPHHNRKKVRGRRTGGDARDGEPDDDGDEAGEQSSAGSRNGHKDRSDQRDLNQAWRSKTSSSTSPNSPGGRSSVESTERSRTNGGSPVVVSSPQRHISNPPSQHRTTQSQHSSRGSRGGFVRGSGSNGGTRGLFSSDQSRAGYTFGHSHGYRSAPPLGSREHRPLEHRGAASYSPQNPVQSGYARN